MIWPIALIASQFTAWSNYDCRCAGFVDAIMAGSSAIRQSKTIHPGEIDLNDTPEIAAKLFQMINFIVEDRITRPAEINALYGGLPAEAREAIDKRDKAKRPN
jgi:hypothetical protein